METRYPLFSDWQTQNLEAMVRRFNLAQSGGSDFHGENKPDIGLGTGKGSLKVPLTFLDGLRKNNRYNF
jgi:hypothetical protein